MRRPLGSGRRFAYLAAALRWAPPAALLALAFFAADSCRPTSGGSRIEARTSYALAPHVAAPLRGAAAAARPAPRSNGGGGDASELPVGLALAILSRGGPDGAYRRALHRNCTLPLLHAAGRRAGVRVSFAFFVANETGDDALYEEAGTIGDVRVVEAAVKDLFARAHAAMRWAAADGARFFMKTDDDSFVRPDLVLADTASGRVPASRLYWGRELGNGRPVSWGHCFFELRGLHATCPRYMSGMGYVLSGDVAAIAAAVDADAYHRNLDGGRLEDLTLGLLLAGLSLTRVDDPRFHDVAGQPGLRAALTERSIVGHHLKALGLRDACAAFGAPALAALL